MRFYNEENDETTDDKENFNPLVKQYSPLKSIAKKRNTILKEITDKNRIRMSIENKEKGEESELGNLFNNMENITRKKRFGREM
ncbi:uncharacterized protein VNE69_07070 [Vairimorpha necatrix]|uniref:Uncharacterized protein n=1 Tax=Vairimorpha necatrix TaxID=6039 RepID=A0AAX4JDF7_9MICR